MKGQTSGEHFGWSIAISDDGETVAVGADHYSNSRGYVKVFKEGENSWDQLYQTLFGSGDRYGFGYQFSLSSDGKTLAASEPWSSVGGTEGGQIKIFREGSNSWVQIHDGIRGQNFRDCHGHSLQLSSDGKTLAFSGYHNSRNGKVLVYREGINSWTQAYATIPEEAFNIG